MCGRFQATRTPDEVARWFKTVGPLPNPRPRYNAAPTQSLLNVIRDPDTGDRRLGYFISEEILACEQAGIAVTLPKLIRCRPDGVSAAQARGRAVSIWDERRWVSICGHARSGDWP